jgi:CRP-like cAMP-binding protein
MSLLTVQVCALSHRLEFKTDGKTTPSRIAWCFVNNQVYARPANRLLSNLAPEDYAQLAPHFRPVKMELGAILGYGSTGNNFAYFPTTSVISLICDMENGATAEVALAGNDGLVGTSLFLGGNTTTNRAIVGISGEALRLDARILKEQFARCPSFQRILLRYTDTLISQISLTAACNRMHKLEKRLCRWLLLIHDRAVSNEFVMTQEFIANMLGGRRETVTVAAGHLQDAGLIHYTRGRLKIIDRAGLENSVCECYRPVANNDFGETTVRSFKYVAV